MTEQVYACIDGSVSTRAVCDYAAWASQRLSTSLILLHVLDKESYPVAADYSGNIGLGSQEQLLKQLAALDEERAKLAIQHGLHMLEAARERVKNDGVANAGCMQRHGDLVDCIAEQQSDMRVLVMGKQGAGETHPGRQVGTHLESVIRTLHRPILVSTGTFKAPERVLFAFDGSQTSRKGIERLVSSPLLTGLQIDILLVGADTVEHKEQVKWAASTLTAAGFRVPGTAIRAGEVDEVIQHYCQHEKIDLLVMGAYGHSRIRQFLVGSTTTSMITKSTIPLLILR